jgi:chitodextrinase
LVLCFILGLSGCNSSPSAPPPDTTSPTAPSGLTSTVISDTKINLSWTASTDNVGVTGYKVERCQGTSCSTFAQIATPATTTFNDTGLAPSTSYSYRVRATDAAGNLSSYSATSTVTSFADTTPPSAPANLTATAISSTQINLSWTASTDDVGVTGYKVERCSGTSCSNLAQIATPTGTTLNDTGLAASTSYSYRVRATDAANNLSTFSSIATASTMAAPDNTPPTAPSGLITTVVSDTQINLSWTASTDNVGVTGYKVERCQGTSCSTFAQIATPATTTFNDTGLAPSTSYSYRVRATDAAGNLSSYSATSTVTSFADTTPPSAPANLTATAISSTQINLSWTASTDDVGVTGYRVESCSGTSCSSFAQIATPTGASFNNTGLTASTSYSYRVRAADAAGNLSSYSATASATTQAPGPVSVTVSPMRAAIAIGQTQTYVATVSNDPQSLGVTWQVDTVPGGSATTLGTVDVNGKYTPPISGTIGGAHTITAVSKADITKTATASVAVTDLPGVFTYHNDNSRTGANQKEFGLTTSTVKTATFGKLFSCAVDSAVYAQPLWIPNVTINAAKHNVILVATERNSVYAFDADASPCVTLWQKNLIDTAHGGTAGESPVPSNQIGQGFGDLSPEVGITGTPVIDSATNTIYVVSKSENTNTSTFFQRIHALDLLTGAEKFGGPANIDSSIFVNGTGDGTAGGQVAFDVRREHQRAALALVNGIVYVCWAAHEDASPYHGWVMSFNASNLSLLNKFNDSPNGRQGGIWMGGGAPAADSSNNLYVITGNGDYDGTNDFGDSILKLSSTLSLMDSFTPSVEAQLDSADLDLGSGGAVVLIDLPSAPLDHQHLLVGGGKGTGFTGQLYSLDRTNLGQFNANDIGARQIFAVGGGIFGTPAFWQNTLYIAGAGTNMQAYTLNPATGVFNTTIASQSPTSYGFPGATASLSSSGSSGGIIWAVDSSLYCTPDSPSCGPAVLHAYDATNLATELWKSSGVAGDKAGNAVKFVVPTVANGKVYVGTRGSDANNGGTGELDVYGLKPN